MLHPQGFNPLAVVAAAVAGFLLGGLWYSRLLFAKTWREEMNLTEEQIAARRAQGGAGGKLLGTFLGLLAASAALELLIGRGGFANALSGVKIGALAGIGLAAALQAPAALFEGRSLRHFSISAGYCVALCLVEGAILGAWR